jgi:hypothetical protein
MSLLANQTAINTTQDFFVTSAGTVESVVQGSNILIGGTSTDPVINFPGPFLTQIVAGSNISITETTVSGAVTATINAPGGEDNPAFYANTQALGTTTNIPAGGSFTFSQVPSAYFVNSNALYRVTIGYEITLATFSATPTGNLNFVIFNGTSVVMDTFNHSMTANIANADANIGATLTTVFRPSQTGGVFFGVLNNTTATVSPLNINFTNYAVEQITDNLTLITSVPPPPP